MIGETTPTPHPRDARGRSVEACAWCGRAAVPAEGAYLALVARGRTLCSGCGRFQLYCECRPGRITPTDRDL